MKAVPVENIKDEKLVEAIVFAMQDKKASKITHLDMTRLPSRNFDHFVVCEAASTSRVVSIADGVDEYMDRVFGISPMHKEGYENAEWILLDYGGILVHVFLEDVRRHFKIEELWADAEIKNYQDEF